MKMDFVIKRLKCDNPSCDFCNLDIPFEEYEKFVNYPCPKCGESLLTPQAYKMAVALKSMGDFITKINGGAKEGATKYTVPLETDKDGNISFKR